MNRVDFLTIEADESPLYILEFTKAKSCSYDIFIGIEGEDQPYYDPIIRSKIRNKKIAYIRCGFRKNVIDFVNYLINCDNLAYRNSFFFALVDNDYDDKFISDYPELIYVTPCYSFENLYTGLAPFRRLLESVFHVKEYDDYFEDFNRVYENFINTRKILFDSLQVVDSIVRTAYLMKKDDSNIFKKTYVSKIKLTQCSFDLGNFQVAWSSVIQDWINNLHEYVDLHTWIEVSKKYNNLDCCSLNYLLRGKIVFDFYIRYIKELLNDELDLENSLLFQKRNSIKKYNQKPENKDNQINLLNVQIRPENLVDPITILASHAEVPENLLDFLDNFIHLRLTS